MGRLKHSDRYIGLFNVYADVDRLIIGQDHLGKALLIKVYVRKDVIGRYGLYLIADEYDRDPALAVYLKNYDKLSPEEQEAYLKQAMEQAQTRLVSDYALRTKVFGEKSLIRRKGKFNG